MTRLWMVVVASGCTAVSPDFELDLERLGGCSDVLLFATDADDTTMLSLELDHPIEAGGDSETSESVTLPDPLAVVTLEVGAAVSDATCDDVVENGGPRVRDTYEAVSGQVDFVIVPDGDGYGGASASATLTDVVLENADGDSVTVEDFAWEDIHVGWLAG